ncbi:uncharacterized protein LOC142172730 [Nicotiana tabacum]|uniref:Uncharacterized protein LOC142172730 n=1 Tax=Nicotiana tabacum TaxID=4097 RepID=A0AC58T5I9_TOBAC
MNTVSQNLVSGIAYASDAHLVWNDLKEKFDKVNNVMIFQLHREIRTISQRTDYVDTYFTKLKKLWSEYDALVPSLGSDCVKSRDYIVHLHQQRLLQFLSGLNESYDQARRQILMKKTEPILNQAYALIIEDESKRSSPYSALAIKADASVLQAGRGTIPRGESVAMQAGRGQPYNGKKPFMRCDYCHKNGHLKKNCYKLVGYPGDFKTKRQVVANNATSVLEHKQQTQINGEKRASCDQVTRHFFTEDQYMQTLNMLNKDTFVPQVNMVGITTSLMTSCSNSKWIFGSGATYHIDASLDLMHSKNKLKGEQKEQDLWSGKVRGIGKEKRGLYVVKDAHIAKVMQ